MKKNAFLLQLAIKLNQAKIGKVEIDSFADKSASWINIQIDNKFLEISFDVKGEKITGIKAFEDIVEVVDHKQIFG